MNKETLLNDSERQIRKAYLYLEYSYHKIIKIDLEGKNLDDFDINILESLEAFTSRFSRVTDIFLSKYVRASILQTDPAFRGTFIDSLNYAIKINLISNVTTWMSVRELRNASVHEYTEDDLIKYFIAVKNYTPFVMEELKNIFKNISASTIK
ncbi:MAG: hypothetical protein HQK51_06975 [Oligoflexia bacterium]|nr:hypothetical protein [Oligoflexia bacterium]